MPANWPACQGKGLRSDTHALALGMHPARSQGELVISVSASFREER